MKNSCAKKSFFILIFFSSLFPLIANGAVLDENRKVIPVDKVLKFSLETFEVQKALAKLGLYIGPENGRLTKETVAAIKIYQRNVTLKPDGKITELLINKLNYTLNIQKLMQRLDRARKKSINLARNRLLKHPATRKLVLSGDDTEVADPTRVPVLCFDEPTAYCLLAEARESAKAVGQNELRDWALGEILIVQARAGLGEKAFETTSRIRDPRLIIAALGDIADARAAAGDSAAAVRAAQLIPDGEGKAKALISISEIQQNRGDARDAKQTLRILLREVFEVNTSISRINFLSRAAAVFFRMGELKAAKTILRDIEVVIRKLAQDEAKDTALRYLASALIQVGDTRKGLDLLKKIKKDPA